MKTRTLLDAKEIDRFSDLTNEMMAFSSLGIRPGLERLLRLLSLLGSPQRDFPAIHVLGTNGKGSTVATVSAVCMRAGLKTAAYTSPHLVSLQERVSVDGDALPIEAWRDALKRIQKAVEHDPVLNETRPTFFESLTALAFLMIRDAGADIAVIEAGMGGRYDASMLCDAVATIVTPIGMDHMEYLGNTLSAIAAEKFAAARPGVPAFYGGDDAVLREQFLQTCLDAGAEAHCLNDIAELSDIRLSLRGTMFVYAEKSKEPVEYFTPLIGLHQAQNAANVISVFNILRDRCPLLRHIGEDEIKEGVASTHWPGRAEVLPKQNGRVVILDGAHNEHGLKAFLATLGTLVSNGSIEPVGALLFGLMKDKELQPLLDLLADLRAPVYCTQASITRALPAKNLEAAILRSGLISGGAYEDPLAALRASESETRGTIVCCGSLFLVGCVKKELGIYD